MRNKTFFYSISCIFALLGFASCGTKKAYVGPRQDNASVATIQQGNHELTIGKKRTSESALLIQVDSISVGDYFKGYPKTCKVLPGEHTIEIRHYQKWNDNQANSAVVGGVLGGAIGGAIAGSIAEKNNPHKHYLVTFTTEAGKSYIITGVTNPETLEAMITVTNAENGEVVESSFNVKDSKK